MVFVYLKRLIVAGLLLVVGQSVAIGHETSPLIKEDNLSVERPNIIFFLVDDLGWRDLSCYGSEFHETPNIDQFAAKSVLFTQAYAACHVCSPTRASIMTGKYPARLGLTDWLPGRRDFPFQKLKNAEIKQHLPLDEITIAETLKSNGYRTAHIGKWHLGEDPFGPLDQGFDIQIPRWNKGWPKAGYHAPFKFSGLTDQPGDYLTDRLTDEAESYIEANRDQPFFLYLSHFSVHDPIQGRVDLVKKYEQKLSQQPTAQGDAFVLEGNPDDSSPLTQNDLSKKIKQSDWSGYQVLPERTVKIKQHQDNVQFAAMVESIDESLGRIVTKLKSLELHENTIIIFFSDNGGMSGANFGRPDRTISPQQLDRAFSTSNLPLRGAKGWLYEGGIREPLIIHWPQKGQQGTICDTPVISTDFYPTLLEMANVAPMPKQHADGISLVSLVTEHKNPGLDSKLDPQNRNAIYWHFPHYSNHGMQSPGGAIRCGDYKLLEYFENNTIQLFNLRDDLGEQHDLSEEQPQLAKELQSKLHQWRFEINANQTRPNPSYQTR